MMKTQRYYVFRPTDELVLLSERWPKEIAKSLAVSCLWTSDEGGKTSWHESDFSARMKLLFLLDHIDAYGKDAFFSFFNYSGNVSIKFVDQWWKVERFRLAIANRQEIEERLPKTLFAEIEDIESPALLEWLSRRIGR